MVSREQLTNQLTRLVHARGDIGAAGSFLSLIMHPGLRPPRPIDLDDYIWGLWTAAVVSYGRPFGSSKLKISSKFERFPEEPQLAHIHTQVLDLRNKLFAHTDDIGHREVTWSRTGWRESRVSLQPRQALNAKALCFHQLERVERAIQELDSRLRAAA